MSFIKCDYRRGKFEKKNPANKFLKVKLFIEIISIAIFCYSLLGKIDTYKKSLSIQVFNKLEYLKFVRLKMF